MVTAEHPHLSPPCTHRLHPEHRCSLELCTCDPDCLCTCCAPCAGWVPRRQNDAWLAYALDMDLGQYCELAYGDGSEPWPSHLTMELLMSVRERAPSQNIGLFARCAREEK